MAKPFRLRTTAMSAKQASRFLVIVWIVGCGYAPTAVENKESRDLVVATVNPIPLDQRTLNEILKTAQDKRDLGNYLSKVFDTEVDVLAIDINSDARDTAGHGKIHLTGRLLENVAPQLDFYFADEDLAKVQELQLNHGIRIRGQLTNAYSTGLIFKGCILDSE
jgi:hypothetical protein